MFITSIPITSFLDDPKDGFLLGLAEAAGADYLVTGDKALLGLQRYGTTAIISATDMLRILIQSNEK